MSIDRYVIFELASNLFASLQSTQKHVSQCDIGIIWMTTAIVIFLDDHCSCFSHIEYHHVITLWCGNQQ